MFDICLYSESSSLLSLSSFLSCKPICLQFSLYLQWIYHIPIAFHDSLKFFCCWVHLELNFYKLYCKSSHFLWKEIRNSWYYGRLLPWAKSHRFLCWWWWKNGVLLSEWHSQFTNWTLCWSGRIKPHVFVAFHSWCGIPAPQVQAREREASVSSALSCPLARTGSGKTTLNLTAPCARKITSVTSTRNPNVPSVLGNSPLMRSDRCSWLHESEAGVSISVTQGRVSILVQKFIDSFCSYQVLIDFLE